MLGYALLLSTLFLQTGPQPQPATAPAFRVIVNAANPVDSISRATLSQMFTRRLRRWPGGLDALPVDQPASARVRELFSRSVHGKSVAYVVRYWHRLIFSGRGIPPMEVPNDAAAIEWVKANPGAVAYVSADSILPPEVKELTVLR